MNSREGDWFVDCLVEKWSIGDSSASQLLEKMSADLWKMTNSLVVDMPFLSRVAEEKTADQQEMERLRLSSWFDCSSGDFSCDKKPTGNPYVASTSETSSEVPLLTRMGLKTTLTFSFALLQRCWRTGEDLDIAEGLLEEWLSAVRGEIRKSSSVSEVNDPIWLAFFRDVSSTLHNLLDTQLCGRNLVAPKFLVPPGDLDRILQLYLEICIQLGSFPLLVKAVLLLLSVEQSQADLGSVEENINLPSQFEFQLKKSSFEPMLQRLQSLFTPLEELIFIQQDSVASRIYFDFLALMEFDCHEFVQLGSIATLLLSLPLAESLEHNRGISNAEPSTEVVEDSIDAVMDDQILWLKSSVENFDWVYRRSYFNTDIGRVAQLIRSENEIYALSRRGKVFQLISSGEKEPQVRLVEGLEMAHISQIAAHPKNSRVLFLTCDGRVLQLDETDLRVQRVEELAGISISSVIQSGVSSAALCQSTGEVFLWTRDNFDSIEIVSNVRWISLNSPTYWAIGYDGSVRCAWVSQPVTDWHHVKQLEQLKLEKIFATDQYCLGVTSTGQLYCWRNAAFDRLKCTTDWNLAKLSAEGVVDIIVMGTEFLCYLIVENGRSVWAMRMKEKDENSQWEMEKFEELKLSQFLDGCRISCLTEDLNFNLVLGLSTKSNQTKSKMDSPERNLFLLKPIHDCFIQLDALLRFCVNLASEKLQLENYENLTFYSLELTKLQFKNGRTDQQMNMDQNLLASIRKSLLTLAGLSEINSESRKLDINNISLSRSALVTIDSGCHWLYPTTSSIWESLAHFCRAALSSRVSTLNNAMVSLLAKEILSEAHLEWLVSRAILAESHLTENWDVHETKLEKKSSRDSPRDDMNSSDVLSTIKLLLKYLTKAKLDQLNAVVNSAPSLFCDETEKFIGDLVEKLLQLILLKFQLSSKEGRNQQASVAVISKFWSFLAFNGIELCQQGIKLIKSVSQSDLDLRAFAQILKFDRITGLLAKFCRELQIIDDRSATAAVFILHSSHIKTLLTALNELNKLFPMWEKEELEEMSPTCRKVADISTFIKSLKWRNAIGNWCDEKPSDRPSRKRKILTEWDVANAVHLGSKWVVSGADVYDISIGSISDGGRNFLQPFVGLPGAESIVNGKLTKKDRQILQTECQIGRLVSISGGKGHPPYELISCTPPLLYLEKLVCFTAGKLLSHVVGESHQQLQGKCSWAEFGRLLAGGFRGKFLSTNIVKSELENLMQSSQLKEGKRDRDDAETFLQLLAFGFEQSTKVASFLRRFQEFLVSKRLMMSSLETNSDLEEMVRWFLASALLHTKMACVALKFAETDGVEAPEELEVVLRAAHDFRWRLIRRKQESGGKSFAEVCAAPLRKCQFLFTRFHPAGNKRWEDHFLQNLRRSDGNRWQMTVAKLMKLQLPLVSPQTFAISSLEVATEIMPKLVSFALSDVTDLEEIEKTAENQLIMLELKTQAYKALLNLTEDSQLLTSCRCCFLLGLNGNVTAVDQFDKTSNIASTVATDFSLVRFTKKVDLAVLRQSFIFAIFSQLREALCPEFLSFEIQIPLTIGCLLTLITPASLPNLIENGLLAVIQSCLRHFGNLYPSALQDLEILCEIRRRVKPTRPKFVKKQVGSPTAFGDRTGPAVLPHLRVGMRVERGPHWKWGNQDSRIQDLPKRSERGQPEPPGKRGRPGGCGTLTSEVGEDGWVRVRWDGGFTNSYRMGKDNKYDLQLVEAEVPLLTGGVGLRNSAKEESAQLHFDLSKKSQVDRPVVMLGSICKAMAYLVCTSAQMGSDGETNKRSWRILSSFLLSTVDRGAILYPPFAEFQRKVWATPEFVGSVLMGSPMVGEILGSKWADSLGRLILSGGEETESLDSRIANIRLLGKVLIFADIPAVCERAIDNFLLLAAKLFCLNVDDHSGDSEERESLRVEMTGVMKNLFLSARYNRILNDKFTSLVNDTFPAELKQEKPMEEGKMKRSAALAVLIGSLSEKLRVGQRVRHLHFGEGEILEFHKESITVRFDRRCSGRSSVGQQIVATSSISPMEPSVSLSEMFPTESAKAIWCQLLASVLEEVHRGETVFKSPLRRFLLTTWMSVVHCAVGDSKFIVDLVKTQPTGIHLATSLFRNSMTFAPLKAFYQTEEIKLACSTLANDESSFKSRPKTAVDTDLVDQTAAFASCSTVSLLPSVPIFASEGGSPGDNNSDNRAALPTPMAFEGIAAGWDDNDFPRRFWPGATGRRNVRRSRTDLFRFDFMEDTWAADMFERLKEMGFDEGKIRRAIRSQGETEFRPSAERMVALLLENDTDRPSAATSPNDFRLDLWLPRLAAELNNSDSAELVNLLNSYRVAELDGARSESSPSPLLPLPPLSHSVPQVSRTYRKRAEFADDHQYAQYVRREITVGCLVRSLNFFEQVRVGDIGKVVRLDKDGLDDLNVQVEWEQRGSIYWVRYSSIELCSNERQHLPDASHLRVGDSVRIRSSVNQPRYEWGSVTPESVGVVQSVRADGTVTVDFPLQSDWTGLTSELESITAPLASKRPTSAVSQPLNDWSSCIRATIVSSNTMAASALFDGRPDTFWQSSGKQGCHWILLEVNPEVAIKSLKMTLDPSDQTYLPSLLRIRVGITSDTLKDAKMISVRSGDTTVNLLGSLKEAYRFIEIRIVQCQGGGIDCRIRGLSVRGCRVRNAIKEKISLARKNFLTSDVPASDYDQMATEISTKSGGTLWPTTANRKCDVSYRVFVWGLNDKEQLGSTKVSKVKVPLMSETLAHLRPRQVAGGSKSLYIVDTEGRVFVCGEAGKKLGDQSADGTPTLVTALRSFVVTKVAVHSGGKHVLVLTTDGQVLAWGANEFGQLGLGHNSVVHSPHLVESLQEEIVVEISCGSSHSAAITADGQLFTWGCGAIGRLGHGNTNSYWTPKLVEKLVGRKVVRVACGSRDAQTICLTTDRQVFTWGDGDFGKLGDGTSQSSFVPVELLSLRDKNIIEVYCGAQFTAALSAQGEVYTWGKGDYFRLGHGTDSHCRQPRKIEALIGQKIVALAIGALHGLALNDQGQVYAWGDNDHGQLGNNSTSVAKEPILVPGLDESIAQLACGSSHSVAWLRCEKEVAPPADPFPIPLEPASDPLGAAELGGDRSREALAAKDDSNTTLKSTTCSIAQIVQTFTTEPARCQALSLLLKDLLVRYSRQAIVGILSDSEVAEMICHAAPLLSTVSTNEACEGEQQIATESELIANSITKDSEENTCESASGKTVNQALTIDDTLERVEPRKSPLPIDYSIEAKRLYVVRSLLHLLKLLIGGRCSWASLNGEANSPETVLVDLISSFAQKSIKVQQLLLHICNDHLIRLSDFGTHGGGASLRPVTLETKHPYPDDSELSGHVYMPGATAIRLEFDQRCSTERLHDPLAIIDCNGKIIGIKSGREWADWSELVVPGDEFYWRFVSDGSVNGWGWKLTAYPIIASQVGTPWSFESSLSDSQVLSHPSFELVKSLLGAQLPEGYMCLTPSGTNVEPMKLLIFNITECLKLNVLATHQQLWVFEYFRQFLVALEKTSAVPATVVGLKSVVTTGLADTLLIRLKKQFDYEEPLVRGGSRLSFSFALKLLISVASDAALDSQLETEWRSSGFIKKFCHVARVVDSMTLGTLVPPPFSREVLARLAELSFDPAGFCHDDNSKFGPQADAQLVDWYQRRPADWTGLAADITGSSQTIFGWGHNHRGQLGGVEGAKVRLPVACDSLSALRPVALVGGEQTLFALTGDGQVWATGYGAGGRLGVGSGDTLSIPTLIESLRRVFIKKVTVSSGGRHSLALSDQNEVYSWGEGEDGKLGHGNRLACEKPKVVESLRGLEVIDIAAGGAHSACVTASKELFTWGKGRYGRLGHGDSEDQLWPKLVKSLADYRVTYVACGSGDAQTLCITDDDCVWSWGDGDYGKLGRGGSDGCKIPMRIDSLQGCGVIRVECGSQFSAALTKDGHVYTWGKGDYYRLGHNSDEHVRRPKLVAGLKGKKVVALACGSLHCLVCTDQGEVYAWGDNDEGQLGDGSVNSVQRPKLISALTNKNVNQVTCGSAHSLAWSTVKPTVTGRLPKEVPVEYDNLQQIPMPVLRNRLILLHLFSDLVCSCAAMLELRAARMELLRPVLLTGKKEANFRKVIQTTMIRDRQHGPVLELNRVQRKRQAVVLNDFSANLSRTVFGQMSAKAAALITQEAQLLPQRVWKVKLVGESVDDCGGGYHDSIAEMLEELQTPGLLPILTPISDGHETGNGQSDHSAMLINPQENSKEVNEGFRFFGMLLGVAIRTASPLNLSLAEPMWKLLTGWHLTPEDMTEIDKDFIPNLVRICDIDATSLSDLEIPFAVRTVSGRDEPLSTCHSHVTFENRFEYRQAALKYKLHEFDTKVQLIREGLATVVPVPLLSLFTPQELETMVCGNPDVPLPLLRSVSVYKGFDQTSSILVEWFWDVMEEFSGWERSLLLRFVWGRARLPRTVGDFRGREFVIQALDKYQPPDHFLPEAYTCFFLLKLPRYSSKVILRNQLRYAIHHCKSIDSDDYARIAEVPTQPILGAFGGRNSGDSDSDPEDFPIPSEFLSPEDIFS